MGLVWDIVLWNLGLGAFSAAVWILVPGLTDERRDGERRRMAVDAEVLVARDWYEIALQVMADMAERAHSHVDLQTAMARNDWAIRLLAQVEMSSLWRDPAQLRRRLDLIAVVQADVRERLALVNRDLVEAALPERRLPA